MNRQNTKILGWSIVGGLFLVCFVVGQAFKNSNPTNNNSTPVHQSAPAAPPVDFAKIDEFVEMALKTKIAARINPQLNEVYVYPEAWGRMNVDDKTNLGYVFAHYCGQKKGTDLYWVEVKDFGSGKRLMKWSEAWGATFY